jgi:hypothetical protein
MSAAATIGELLDREPFEPFRVITPSGESYVVRHPHLVAFMKSEVFIAYPNSDRRAYVPLLHIASVEVIGNGCAAASRRRRRR